MKFVFVCPNQNEAFESADFSILENRGVLTDAAGNKTLDAKVALNQPCPFCGQKHVYHAGELSCPFGSSEKNERRVYMEDIKKIRLTQTVAGSG